MEKNISPKVYESQKNVVKANAIIKSSGFTLGMEQQKEPAYLSKEKAQREEYRTEHKNPSIFIAAR